MGRGSFLSKGNSMHKGIKQHVCVIVSYHCIKHYPKTQWLKPIIISHGLACGLVDLAWAQLGTSSIPCMSLILLLMPGPLACLCLGISRGARVHVETCIIISAAFFWTKQVISLSPGSRRGMKPCPHWENTD